MRDLPTSDETTTATFAKDTAILVATSNNQRMRGYTLRLQRHIERIRRQTKHYLFISPIHLDNLIVFCHGY